jgi:hypothetical protein
VNGDAEDQSKKAAEEAAKQKQAEELRKKQEEERAKKEAADKVRPSLCALGDFVAMVLVEHIQLHLDLQRKIGGSNT